MIMAKYGVLVKSDDFGMVLRVFDVFHHAQSFYRGLLAGGYEPILMVYDPDMEQYKELFE